MDLLNVRRVVSATLFVGAASAALALAGPDALMPFKDVAGGATEVGVALVIDFGAGAPVVSGCVNVPASDNGYQALAAFVQQENLAAPTFSPSGLLCSINNDPSSGCGQPAPGGFDFWSYWYMTDGSGTWTYASRGASVAVGNATAGQDVEGWRFQNPGPDNSSAPPPRQAPGYSAICPPAPPQAPGPSTTVMVGQQPQVTTATVAQSSPSTTSGGVSTPIVPAGSRASATTTAPSSTTGTTRPVSSGGTGATSTTSSPASTGHTAALGASPASQRKPGAGSALPLAIGAMIVTALTAAAMIRWRKRPRSP